MTTIRISTPEEIAARGGAIAPPLRFPERAAVFAEREMRLRQLAAGHAMRDYLIFVADVAHEQQRWLSRGLQTPALTATALADATEQQQPPLAPGADGPPPAWREVLRDLVGALQRRVGGGAPASTLAALAGASDAWLDQQAERLLHGVMLGLDLGAAPLVAAALQVVWTEALLRLRDQHAAALGPALLPPIGERGHCPACGSRPSASIVCVDGEHAGQRYLHCALCSLQWHHTRAQCPRCGSEGKLHFETLQAEPGHPVASTGLQAGSVRAECCDACGHYLKMVHLDKDAHADPIADDLASLTLDLLVAETGAQRHGVNLMLLFGDSEGEGGAPAGPGSG